MPLSRQSRLLPLTITLLARAARAVPLPLGALGAVGLFEVGTEPGEPPVENSSEFTVRLTMSVVLVLLGGVFAGLTIGLMGQDEVYLQVTAESGEPNERVCAAKVLRLLSKGKHWVLVTLLLSNVITNETLPIVLDRLLGGGWPAVLSSTAAIVVFGEIIPQSICVRYGLPLGAYFAPFVKVLMYAMYPVAVPIARLLDYALGEDHGTVYKKAGLKSLVTLHHHIGLEPLNDDEVTIISAVLDLKDKPVSTIMTPIEDVFVLSSDTVLDETMVEKILLTGFNRIPVHVPGDPLNFIGMLLVRTLITYDPDDALPISSFSLATLPETCPDTSCLNILNYFQEGKSHMVAVSTSPGEVCGPVGVVTLEDVIEELIGEEIVDESDVFVDVHRAIRRVTPAPMLKHVGNIGNIGNVGSAKAGLMQLRPSNRASDPKTTSNTKITIRRGLGQPVVVPQQVVDTPAMHLSAYSDRDTPDPHPVRSPRSPGTIVTKTRSHGHDLAEVMDSEREAVARNINSEAERRDQPPEPVDSAAGADGEAAAAGPSDAATAGAPAAECAVADDGSKVTVAKKKKSKSRRKQGRPLNLAEHTIDELKEGDAGDRPAESQTSLASQEDEMRPSFSENLVRVNGVNKVVIQEISSSSDDDGSSTVSPTAKKPASARK